MVTKSGVALLNPCWAYYIDARTTINSSHVNLNLHILTSVDAARLIKAVAVVMGMRVTMRAINLGFWRSPQRWLPRLLGRVEKTRRTCLLTLMD